MNDPLQYIKCPCAFIMILLAISNCKYLMSRYARCVYNDLFQKHLKKNLEPFWSSSENGKFRKGNSNDARNYIIDILSIVGAIVFLLILNWTLVIYVLDVLWGQLIKLIQIFSTSEFHEYWWNDIFFCPLYFVQGLRSLEHWLLQKLNMKTSHQKFKFLI